MICGVFGLPRAGKTTFLTYLALEALKGKALHVGHLRWRKKIGEFAPYERVFCNFPLAGTFKLDFDALGVYDFSNSLILIDEIMLVCDSRDWANFRHDLRDFLALHNLVSSTPYHIYSDHEERENPVNHAENLPNPGYHKQA